MTTGGSHHPADGSLPLKPRLPRYVMAPGQTILRDTSVMIVNEDDAVITSETPLINGLYYPDYASNVSLCVSVRLV